MVQAKQENNFLERSGWIWMAAFYGAVIVPVVLALRSPELVGRRAEFLLLSLGIALLHTAAMVLVARYGFVARQRSWPQALMLLIAFLLWYRVVQISPIFYAMLFGIYSQIYLVTRIRMALVLGAILTGVVTLSQFDGTDSFWSGVGLLYFLGFSAFGGILGIWIHGIVRQSSERQEIIQQLRDAQEKLAQAERREGMLAERQRLAREIHDTLAQGFTSIVMHLEAAEQALPDGAETSQRHLNMARGTARESLREARRVVQDLRPEILEEGSLPRAIVRTVERWSRESSVGGHAVITGDVLPLHPEVEVTLLRAVQEALSNVRKHAEATAATVTLSYMNDLVMLDVQDDGVGMARANGATELSSGFGLHAMRERISRLSGSMFMESTPGEGTTLVVEIPVTGRSTPTGETKI